MTATDPDRIVQAVAEALWMLVPHPNHGQWCPVWQRRAYDETACDCWQREKALRKAEVALATARPLIAAEAKVEALMDAADELEALVDSQHPDALNPDQWLRDRADDLEGQ